IYNDVRLVFAPESSIASFGGDPDNYEYPRFCLDCALFRAYEDDKPAKVEHFLKWHPQTGNLAEKYQDGKLSFVSGFPGRTERAFTREHLEYQRDVYFPWRLEKLFRREVIYSAFGNRSPENYRRIDNDLHSARNYRKRAMGQLQGLQTPSLWKDVPSVKNSAENSPEHRIAESCNVAAHDLYIQYDMLEGGEAFNCRTFQIARHLVRLATELEKPNEERLKEYQDGNLDSLKRTLFADTPIHEDVEILKLTDSLTMLSRYASGEYYTADSPKVIKNRSPHEAAMLLINGSKVRDVAERKRLLEGGKEAITTTEDAMIKFVLEINDESISVRKRYEEKVENPMTAAYAELAKKRFEQFGTSIYPDATFTIRLSFGKIAGYKEDDGTEVKPFTTIAGVFERYEKQKRKPPFDLPKSWLNAKDVLDLSVPFNFVTTNDIVGGNSGSPMVNENGEIVGLAFDGNIHSLSNNFVYSDKQSRCVGVCSTVIVEALRKVYKADRLADELGK
ncbi:MAG: S46 family peptidase, partial [Planctomycetaceae bacterium]|nr:S46 family peptidase [Planctomycetaceae bacterium]